MFDLKSVHILHNN
uniref:Uncharacterized protein n=1 Tax=Arundo donax TaxID=35708 RepID=A0A0A9AHU9_ARUDO